MDLKCNLCKDNYKYTLLVNKYSLISPKLLDAEKILLKIQNNYLNILFRIKIANFN